MDGEYTFRAWNANKLKLPYGESTDTESQLSEMKYLSLSFCSSDELFSEVIDFVSDTKESHQTYLDKQKLHHQA